MGAVERVSGFEELTGWRAWRVIGDRPPSPGSRLPIRLVRLESVTQSTDRHGVDGVWPTDRWFEGRCLVEPEHNADDARERFGGIPVETCSCGVYAAKSLQQLQSLHYHGSSDSVVGEVGFSGKVIEGRQGWRAELARIRRLWVPVDWWRYIEPLENAYRVPVGFARIGAGGIELLDDEFDDDEDEEESWR